MILDILYILPVFAIIILAPSVVVISKYRLYEHKYKNISIASISIVIAAKNEKQNVKGLLSSLSNLDYPNDKHEIIIVDDNSSDGTFDKLKKLTSERHNLRIIKANKKKYEGKRGAVDLGIEASKFDHIAITDADCRPEKKWLKEISRLFGLEADYILGPAIFYRNKSLLSGIISYENFRNQLMMQGFAYSNSPYAGSAGNFAFSKKAYYQVKGFSGMEKSISGDDDLLIQKFKKAGMKVASIASTEAKVLTFHEEKLPVYLRQKRRHVSASFHYSGKDKIFLGLINLANILLTFSLIAGLFSFNILLLSTGIIKSGIFIWLSKRKAPYFNYRFNIFEAFLYDVFYELLQIYNFFSSVLLKKVWK